MWREYAQSGEGLSIGFRPRAITDMHGRISKVRYISKDDDEEIQNLVREETKTIEGVSLEKVPFETKIESITSLLSVIIASKHRSWSYEDEVRLNFVVSKNRNDPKVIDIPISTYPDGREMRFSAPTIVTSLA
jgi:hypothetical protein